MALVATEKRWFAADNCTKALAHIQLHNTDKKKSTTAAPLVRFEIILSLEDLRPTPAADTTNADVVMKETDVL